MSSDMMLGRTGNATVVDGNLFIRTEQSLEPDSLSAVPQPSVEHVGNAVVYTEAMSPLTQLLCRESLNGSGRSELARTNKRVRERERKQRKKATRKALELAAPDETLTHASLLGGGRKQLGDLAAVNLARVPLPLEAILRPLQSMESAIEPLLINLNFERADNDLMRGLFTAFQDLAEANHIVDELRLATDLREVGVHREAERVALNGPTALISEFEHMDLHEDLDEPAAPASDSDLPNWAEQMFCEGQVYGGGKKLKPAPAVPTKLEKATKPRTSARIARGGKPSLNWAKLASKMDAAVATPKRTHTKKVTPPKRSHTKKSAPSKVKPGAVVKASRVKVSKKSFQKAGAGVVSLVHKTGKISKGTTYKAGPEWGGENIKMIPLSPGGSDGPGDSDGSGNASDSSYDGESNGDDPSSDNEPDDGGSESSGDDKALGDGNSWSSSSKRRRSSNSDMKLLVAGLANAISGNKKNEPVYSVSKHRWDVSNYKGQTPEQIRQRKMYWLQDELSSGLLQGIDNRKKIEVFQTLLEGDDRIRLNNKVVALGLAVTWEVVRDYWLFPDGKSAAITELRGIVRRPCGATESMRSYLDALIEGSRRLRELCTTEQMKPAALEQRELITTFREGLIVHPGSASERMYTWILKKEHMGATLITIDALQAKIANVMHEEAQLTNKRGPPKRSDGNFRTFLNASDEAEYKQWRHEQEVCDDAGTADGKVKGGSRRRTSFLSGEGILPHKEIEIIESRNEKSDTVERHFRVPDTADDDDDHKINANGAGKGKAAPTKRKTSMRRTTVNDSDDSDDNKPIITKKQKAALKIIVASLNSAGGRGPGISGANQTPLGRTTMSDPCRHCGKVVEGTFIKHNCDNKASNKFWCEGCAGVIPDVTTPEFWILHLHTCPKMMCRRCKVSDHCSITCPLVSCKTCSKNGHTRLLHFYERNASQEFLALLGEPINLKMAKPSRERRGGFKRTVHFNEEDIVCDGSTMGSLKSPRPFRKPKCGDSLNGSGGERGKHSKRERSLSTSSSSTGLVSFHSFSSSSLRSDRTSKYARSTSSSSATNPIASNSTPLEELFEADYAVALVFHRLQRTDFEHLKLVSKNVECIIGGYTDIPWSRNPEC